MAVKRQRIRSAWWFAATTIAHDLVVEGPPIAPLPLGWHVHPCATITGGVTTPAAGAAAVEAGPMNNPAAKRPANSRILARRILSSLTRVCGGHGTSQAQGSSSGGRVPEWGRHAEWGRRSGWGHH